MRDAYGAHDALGLAALVARGEASAVELLDEALARAAALNPRLNALVLLQPDVARRMIAAGLPEGPLRGVPFLLKDLGAEAVDFPAHNGSRLLADTRYPVDGEFYLRLRRAGLVPFGRTCAPEGGVGAVT
ncbi:MAG: amidase, partial [Alphaproteobacteria bacterium HGW-Alphaproteobacteria-8]